MPRHPLSDHGDGERFFNPVGPIDKSFWDLLKWMLTREREAWPKMVRNRAVPKLPADNSGTAVHLTFINHVTFLLQTCGFNIITDPVFANRASPAQWIGPRRVRPPGLALRDLPKIDVVLLSHNHYDHMDLAALNEINRRDEARVITPLGNGQILKSVGITNVVETDWWDETGIGPNFSVVTTPAQHWSARGILDRNRALWGGFLMRFPRRQIFFAGDTGFADHFKQIYLRYGPTDLALLPIGAYAPRWFMKMQHMNPLEAVQAHLDLHAARSVGMHYGTFQLTDEGIDSPLRELEDALKLSAGANDFSAMEVGETRKFL